MSYFKELSLPRPSKVYTEKNPFIGFRGWHCVTVNEDGTRLLKSNFANNLWTPHEPVRSSQGYFAWSFRVRSTGYGGIHGAVNLWGNCYVYNGNYDMCAFEYAYPRYFWYNKRNEKVIKELGKIYGVRVYPYPKLKRV